MVGSNGSALVFLKQGLGFESCRLKKKIVLGELDSHSGPAWLELG